jgi:tetratricopeptide (TPR) repeat protein
MRVVIIILIAVGCAHTTASAPPASAPASAPASRPAPNRVMTFAIARDAWKAGRCVEAISELDHVIELDATDDTAGDAANLILDCLNKSKRYDEIVARARLWASDARFVELRKRVESIPEIIDLADRKDAERLEETANYGDAAAAYRKLYERHHDVESLYNAGVMAHQAGLNEEARRDFQEVLDKFPSSPLAAKLKKDGMP